MDLTKLLILQIIAHALTDFCLQPIDKAHEKNTQGFGSSYLKWHVLLTFLASWVLSFQLTFVFGSLIIALFHGLIDGTKKYLIRQGRLTRFAFFIDQAIHLVVITLTVILFDRYFISNPLFNAPFDNKSLLIIAGYILCTKPANIFIREILNSFDIKVDKTENRDLPNAGKLIGIVERFLVLTFILVSQFEAVGFLIAAKSILRFKEDDTIKTEYVLIGTMLSFGIAVAIGILVNQLLPL
jgi:hypothetical protein